MKRGNARPRLRWQPLSAPDVTEGCRARCARLSRRMRSRRDMASPGQGQDRAFVNRARFPVSPHSGFNP